MIIRGTSTIINSELHNSTAFKLRHTLRVAHIAGFNVAASASTHI